MTSTIDRPHDATERIDAIRPLVLRWFSQHARDLPWRRTRNPYHIMVSEIMLQQTQVDRVIPKYLAFLEAFPTVEALVNAATADVIQAWAGLGYNRRAVNMQRAARAVVEQHSGLFPHEVAELRALPGIGPYTAGAIACFAFERDVGFIDTNIRRVLQRVFFEPDQAPTERMLASLAAEAVPAGLGWAWNQGIMELGALICTAANPQCWRCPLREHCRDYTWRRMADEQMALDYGGATQTPRRRVAEKRETPFSGSSRYFRGRVIDMLREHAAGLALSAIGPRLKDDYTPDDIQWLETLIAGLERDGLIERHAGLVRLPR